MNYQFPSEYVNTCDRNESEPQYGPIPLTFEFQDQGKEHDQEEHR